MKSMFDDWQKGPEGIPKLFGATREVVHQLDIFNGSSVGHWASQIVSSQLYKISPSEGNPKGELRYKQRSEPYNCVNLFKMELELYRPKLLLLWTGWKDWASDFIGEFAPDVRPLETQMGRFVEVVGNLQIGDHQTRCVVACRP